MKQEDYNAMMRRPWELGKRTPPATWKQCPHCRENYAGDGVALCAECETTRHRVAQGE